MLPFRLPLIHGVTILDSWILLNLYSPLHLFLPPFSLYPLPVTHAILLPSKMRRLTELKFVILFVLVIVIILTCIVSHLSTNQVATLERKWRFGKKMAPMESSEVHSFFAMAFFFFFIYLVLISLVWWLAYVLLFCSIFLIIFFNLVAYYVGLNDWLC